jgi:hypothetical protein
MFFPVVVFHIHPLLNYNVGLFQRATKNAAHPVLRHVTALTNWHGPACIAVSNGIPFPVINKHSNNTPEKQGTFFVAYLSQADGIHKV